MTFGHSGAQAASLFQSRATNSPSSHILPITDCSYPTHQQGHHCKGGGSFPQGWAVCGRKHKDIKTTAKRGTCKSHLCNKNALNSQICRGQEGAEWWNSDPSCTHPYMASGFLIIFPSFFSAPVGVQSIVINPSVCLSASICLEPLDRSSLNFVRRCPVAWLGPPLAALHYVMYFRFYGWRHVWP